MWWKYLGTKFLLSAASLAGGFYLAYTCKTSMGDWVALTGVVLGTYNFANVAQDWVTMKKSTQAPKE